MSLLKDLDSGNLFLESSEAERDWDPRRLKLRPTWLAVDDIRGRRGG